MNKIKASIAYTGCGMMFFQMSNFFIAILIANYFGTQELASYQLLIVTATLMSYFAKLGQDEKIAYALPAGGGIKVAHQRYELILSFKKTFIMSLVVYGFFLFSVFLLPINNLSFTFVELTSMFIYLPVFVLASLIFSIFRGEQNMRARSLVAYILPNILNFFALFVCYLFAFPTGSAMLSRAFAYLFVMLFSLFLLRKLYAFSLLENVSAPTQNNKISDIRRQSWLLITVLTFLFESGFLVFWSGKLLLSESDFGIQAVLMRIAMLIILVPTVINLVAAPIFAKDSNNRKAKVYLILANLTCVFILSTTIYLFRDFTVSLFIEIDNIDTNILLLLISAFFAFAISQPINVLLISKGKGNSIILILVLAILILFTSISLLKHYNDMVNTITYSFFYTAIFVCISKYIFLIFNELGDSRYTKS